MFYEFIREGRKPIGCIVILHEEGEEYVGYSFVNPKDSWNKKLAVEIATGRAKKWKVDINGLLNFAWINNLPARKSRLLKESLGRIKFKLEASKK